jgi:F-type H+-transporting ATPase subunit c
MSRRRHYAAAMLTGLVVLLFAPAVLADAGENAADNLWGIAIGAGIGIGIAAFGGALGQARAAAAALDGIARNPGASGKIFTPMILGLALIESLVIYAFVITIMLTTKIPSLGDITFGH